MAITDTQSHPASVGLLIRRIVFYVTLVALGLIVAADFVMHAFDFAELHLIHVTVHEIVSATILVVIISQLIAPTRHRLGAGHAPPILSRLDC